MKTPQEAPATLVTTAQQRELIRQLLHDHLEEGGCVFAQVFEDGLRVRVMTPAQAQKLAAALGEATGHQLVQRLVKSAFDPRLKGAAP